MSDMNKRGPDDDCEGEGERGERGERGRRGHRGHRGRDGRDGATGPTGPAGSSTDGFTGPTGATGATGATGPAGSSEGQGLAAYGHAVGINNRDLNPGFPVDFDLGGTPFPNTGITVPPPNGTTFTVLTSGDYEYDFYVAAHVRDVAATVELELTIFVNGVSAGAAHAFRANHQTTMGSDDVAYVRGQGLISLVAGDNVTLQITSPSRITVTAVATGGLAPGANRTLSLKKLSA